MDLVSTWWFIFSRLIPYSWIWSDKVNSVSWKGNYFLAQDFLKFVTVWIGTQFRFRVSVRLTSHSESKSLQDNILLICCKNAQFLSFDKFFHMTVCDEYILARLQKTTLPSWRKQAVFVYHCSSTERLRMGIKQSWRSALQFFNCRRPSVLTKFGI